jgi:hypothetical protein
MKDLGVSDLPPLDEPITDGDLAFHYHSRGPMAVPADWKAFLDSPSGISASGRSDDPGALDDASASNCLTPSAARGQPAPSGRRTDWSVVDPS